MRDILLVLLFVGILPFALRYTWVGVLLWTWFSVMNPHRLAYGFAADLPFAMVAAVATFISMIPSWKQLRFPRDPAVVCLVLFSIWMCVSTLFALLPERSLPLLDRALKIQLMTLVALMAIHERKHIELFLWVNVLSLGFYGVKGGVFTLASGGEARVWGPSQSMIQGNNELGLALVMVIPLMNYLRLVATRAWVRHGLLAAMILSAAAALGTQSRGTFLAFVAMGVVLLLRSRRKVLGGGLILISGLLLISFMPDSWEARMTTITNYQADASAMGRVNAWQTALNIANDRITGGGFMVATKSVWDVYSPAPDWVLTAHSIYFQAIGEQGWIGFLLFVALGVFGFVYASRVRKQARSRPETLWLHDLAGMLQVSMVGYAVGGAFLSLTYFDLPYNVLVIVIACRHWLKEERWKTDKAGAFGATAPSEAKLSTAAPRAARVP